MNIPADSRQNRRARGPVDWSAVHAQLERTAATLSATEEPLEDDRKVLLRRARELAAPIRSAPLPSLTAVITFQLADQTFGLSSAQVREVLTLREFTPLPGLPAWVRGLANIHSRVLPLFDLRPLLDLDVTAGNPLDRLIVVCVADQEFALAVDAVTGTRAVPTDAGRRQAPGLDQRFVERIADDGLLVLDLPALASALTLRDEPLSQLIP